MKTKNLFGFCFCIYILIVFSGSSYAQHEIPESIKANIQNGINYLENSKTFADIDKAVIEFTEAATKAPEYPEVHYFLAKTLSMKPGYSQKAITEYNKYLELYPNAPDKEKVNKQIAQLEETIKNKDKNKLYTMGLSLIRLSDGIYVRQVTPNYPGDFWSIVSNARLFNISDTGESMTDEKIFNNIQAGDKIIEISNTKIKDFSVQDVSNFIMKDTGTSNREFEFCREVTVMRADKKIKVDIVDLLFFARHKYDEGTKKYVHTNKIIRDEDFTEYFKSLGDGDLNEIIKSAKALTLVFFLSDFCKDCERYGFILSQLAGLYKDTINFIIVNTDENNYVAKEYEISKTPSIYLYKEGKLADKIIGYDYKLLVKKVKALMK